jgi:hypothetical protein
MNAAGTRTSYPAEKYAAVHLMFARWLRLYSERCSYRYVTLGGTELTDIRNLNFIDETLTTLVVSFETNRKRLTLAQEAATLLKHSRGISIKISAGDIFDYKRDGDEPHIFFIDLEGICQACSSSDYPRRFADMFRRETLKEGDALFITSYLGRNKGWERLFETYQAEFCLLQLSGNTEKREWYRKAHPSFTLYRALTDADLTGELALSCFGSVEYRGSSTMGLYGYSLSGGNTDFTTFIRSTTHLRLRA